MTISVTQQSVQQRKTATMLPCSSVYEKVQSYSPPCGNRTASTFSSQFRPYFMPFSPFVLMWGEEKRLTFFICPFVWRRGAGDVINCLLWLEGMEEWERDDYEGWWTFCFIYLGALTLLPTKTPSTYNKSWYMHIVPEQQPAISSNVCGDLENEVFMWWIMVNN